MPVLENTAAVIDATLDETWTVGLINSRLELLERYWCMFEENHVALIQAKTPQETPYLAQGTHSRMEAMYVEARGRLFDAEARLRRRIESYTSTIFSAEPKPCQRRGDDATNLSSCFDVGASN